MRSIRFLMMARTQLPNLALPRSPEDGLAGSGSAFDKQFTAGTRAVGIAGEGQDFGVTVPRLRSLGASEGNRRDVGGTLRAAGPAPACRIARCVLEGGAPAAMGRRASRRRTRTASSGAAGVRRRSFAVLAGTTGRPRSGEFHRGRPPLSADPDQSRDDGGVRPGGHGPRVDTCPGPTTPRSVGRRRGTWTTSTGQSSRLDISEPKHSTSTAGTRSSPS